MVMTHVDLLTSSITYLLITYLLNSITYLLITYLLNYLRNVYSL